MQLLWSLDILKFAVCTVHVSRNWFTVWLWFSYVHCSLSSHCHTHSWPFVCLSQCCERNLEWPECIIRITLIISLSFGCLRALTLLVGHQEEHLACKNWVMRYWHGYLSGARSNWFAYGQAEQSELWWLKLSICQSNDQLTWFVPWSEHWLATVV